MHTLQDVRARIEDQIRGMKTRVEVVLEKAEEVCDSVCEREREWEGVVRKRQKRCVICISDLRFVLNP